MEQTPDTIRAGSRVRLHFSITLEDGTVAESTFEDTPIDVVIGDGTLHEGLEKALYGLTPDDTTRSIKISPEQGFGMADPDARHTMSRDEFSTELNIEPGVIVLFTTPAGDEVPGTILAVDDNDVIVDFNHPLAGREIDFKVAILAVCNEPTHERNHKG